jgi:hypothetical protein
MTATQGTSNTSSPLPPDARQKTAPAASGGGRWTLRPRPPEERRRGTATALSIVLHVILGAALLRILMLPLPLQELFKREKAEKITAERISFLALPTGPTTTPGKSGGDGRPISREPRPAPPPLVPPSTIPSTIPPAPATAQPTAPEGGSGAIIGEGGRTRGVRPTFADPRIWVPSAPVVSAPKSASDRLDSVIVSGLTKYADSMAIANPGPTKFERGDWTVGKDGQKWGIDQQFIRLGKVSIPTALLGLLPLNNMQGNPIAYERNKALAAMRADIMYHAEAQINEQEFRKTVRAIRERKERERKDQDAKKGDKVVAPETSKNP